ncbi:MAG: hypothetical protein ACI9K1_001641, partial [Arcticibacterium sp.]
GGTGLAGGKMKEAGLAHWTSPNSGATNESGFAGLPGGYRSPGRTLLNIGNFGDWWSYTEYNTTDPWNRELFYGSDNVYRGSNDKGYGFSVRCLRD